MLLSLVLLPWQLNFDIIDVSLSPMTNDVKLSFKRSSSASPSAMEVQRYEGLLKTMVSHLKVQPGAKAKS